MPGFTGAHLQGIHGTDRSESVEYKTIDAEPPRLTSRSTHGLWLLHPG